MCSLIKLWYFGLFDDATEAGLLPIQWYHEALQYTQNIAQVPAAS